MLVPRQELARLGGHHTIPYQEIDEAGFSDAHQRLNAFLLICTLFFR